ncbi:ABC transporter F family member 4-like [Dromaius novaehollandiae]|uniref:ABC transporter F family member 4-like n=1 Tax=Dromaius novaehollandiae TaxID=8790 RepID=UPI00311FFC7E
MGISRASGTKAPAKAKSSISRKHKSELDKGQDVPKMPRGKAVRKELEETLCTDQAPASKGKKKTPKVKEKPLQENIISRSSLKQEAAEGKGPSSTPCDGIRVKEEAVSEPEQPKPTLRQGPAPGQEGASRSEHEPRRAGTAAGRRIPAPQKVPRQREMRWDGANGEVASVHGEPGVSGEVVADEAGLDVEERREEELDSPRLEPGARGPKRKRGGNGEKQERRKRQGRGLMRKDADEEEDKLEEGDLGTRAEEQGAGEGRNRGTEQGKAGRTTRRSSPIPGRGNGAGGSRERAGRGDGERGGEDGWGEQDGADNGGQAGPSRGKKRPEKVKAEKSKKVKSERGKSREREEKGGRKKVKKEKISEAEQNVEWADEEQEKQEGERPGGSKGRVGKGKESEDEKGIKQEEEEEDEQGGEGQETIWSTDLGQEVKEEGDAETEVPEKDKKRKAKAKKPKEETKEKGKKSKEKSKESDAPEKTRKRKSKEEGEEKNSKKTKKEEKEKEKKKEETQNKWKW